MWVVLLLLSVAILIIIKAGLEKLKVYPKKCNVYQEQFHCHFNSQGHNGMDDWKITIIDRAENILELGVERVIGNTGLMCLFLMS